LWNRLGHNLQAFLTPHTNIDWLISWILYATNQNSPPKKYFPTFIIFIIAKFDQMITTRATTHKWMGKKKKKDISNHGFFSLNFGSRNTKNFAEN
jgi:hypothetical protein